jgi:23S rRNA (adenine2503-C2)-methyltransferase
MQPVAFLELSPEQLKKHLQDAGWPDFRRKQIQKWIFQQNMVDFSGMTDLPQSMRRRLQEHFSLWTTEVVRAEQAGDETQKLLLKLRDGNSVECVLLRDRKNHRTACISTQVGCAMGCVFCASGLGGFVRNLTRGEILEQLLHLSGLLGKDEKLTHVVVMGMGEPLLNLEALLGALETVASPEGWNVSVRRITISTVGIPSAIRRLASLESPYRLAVSLHAPDDALRNRLIPANRKYNIASVMEAVDDYFRQSGRRVTFEYVLLSGINDQREHAERLADLLMRRTALVNLLPMNPVAELDFSPPPPDRVRRFVDVLEKRGIDVQVRFRKGDRIDAACGQLRRETLLRKGTK